MPLTKAIERHHEPMRKISPRIPEQKASPRFEKDVMPRCHNSIPRIYNPPRPVPSSTPGKSDQAPKPEHLPYKPPQSGSGLSADISKCSAPENRHATIQFGMQRAGLMQ
ncbi:hypothetical protein B0O99DRAFT_593449 [Bisporella sp. PMI_857]|nr:hypothetical protein B0O99DRAFT_593449 [Bisporella sp. PMI_857]